jgi:superfamily II DNA/RNA helicase
MERPDIVIGTPTRILAHIQAGNLSIKQSLEMLVIDEADLVFSFTDLTSSSTKIPYYILDNRFNIIFCQNTLLHT